MYLAQDEVEKALRSIQTYSGKLRDKILLTQGKCFDKVKNFTEANTCYQEALNLSKRDDAIKGEVLSRLGWNQLKPEIGQLKEGLRNLELAAELCPNSLEILLKLVGAINQAEEPSNQNSKRILTILAGRTDSESLFLQAKALYKLQEYTQAIDLVSKALAEEPNKPNGYFLLGSCFEKI